ncbi:unnamed protein product [Adineta steineri]|uniref:Large-conductance mechanosensitive channel n=1 Tax=Adineta steineri TaxID=433720 RepID=A0A814BGK8_9BILA|nr:unnamed protein product [Adineta steineri]CAF3695320.1 unnamed protein product [Adineta steineri]
MTIICRYCSKFWNEFRTFTLRGNVLDMAVGLIIGTAFANVVKSLVEDILTPPLGLILGGVDLVNLTIIINNFIYIHEPPIIIRYGKFLQATLYLVVIGLVFFLLLRIINDMRDAIHNIKITPETFIELTEHTKVLREIRDLLSFPIKPDATHQTNDDTSTTRRLVSRPEL